MLNSDYKDILSALSDEKVKCILVGAYALAVHGFPRADLIINKRAAGRTKDRADAEMLENGYDAG